MSGRYIPIAVRPAADPGEPQVSTQIRPVVGAGRDKMAESTDPYVATVVSVPTPGHDGLAAMGRAFVEEFARMGWSRQRIARMFRIPRYVAAHAVYQARGSAFVEGLIVDVLGPDADDRDG